MSNLDWPNAKEEIKVAVDYLGKNGRKVGVRHDNRVEALRI
jgi:hypothetical protein